MENIIEGGEMQIDNSKINHAYMIYIDINSTQAKQDFDRVEADNKIEVLIEIDGVRKEMSLQEFKDKIFNS